jgi:tetratricopeptide (TPR) repeat protein
MKETNIIKFLINILLCALVVVFLSACAASLPPTEDEPAEVAVDSDELLTVAALADGRRGFVINEPLESNAANTSLEADFLLAVQLFEENQNDEALALLEQIVASEPQLSAPYINLARVYRQMNMPEKAEERLKDALGLIPGHPLASQEYGLLLRQAGRFTEAQTIYAEALELFPDYLPLRKNLGILCDLYLNDTECALEQFQYYHAAQPEDEKVSLWISEIQLR